MPVCIVPKCPGRASEVWNLATPKETVKVGLCYGHAQLARSGFSFQICLGDERLEVMDPMVGLVPGRLDA